MKVKNVEEKKRDYWYKKWEELGWKNRKMRRKFIEADQKFQQVDDTIQAVMNNPNQYFIRIDDQKRYLLYQNK